MIRKLRPNIENKNNKKPDVEKLIFYLFCVSVQNVMNDLFCRFLIFFKGDVAFLLEKM